MRHGRTARVAGHVERVLALRTFPGLSYLAPQDLAVLGEIARERYFRRGVELMKPGEPVTAIQFIRRGKVSLLRDGVVGRSFGPGAVVGGLAAMTRDPAGQHVIVEEPTDTFELFIDDMEDVFEDSFALLHAVLRSVSTEVAKTRLELPGNAGFDPPEHLESSPRGGLSAVERILFVRRLVAYGRARIEAIAELTREMEEERLPAGHVLWEEGDPALQSHLIVSGVVECTTSRGHHFRFGPSSVVGGIDSLGQIPRWYRASARTDVIALESDVAHLLDVIEEHPDMGLSMLRVLAQALLHLQARRDTRALGAW